MTGYANNRGWQPMGGECRAGGWLARWYFGCGDAANQAAGEEEEEREARGEGEFMDAKSASERTESGRLPATRDEISEQLYFAVWLLQGKREKKRGRAGGGRGESREMSGRWAEGGGERERERARAESCCLSAGL